MKKRSKMLALIMVLAFALTGVGYAWWTDTLFINGTVETGDLEVKYQEICGVFPLAGSSDYVTATAWYSEDLKTCYFEVEGLYPGAIAVLDAQLKNYGSIPAKFAGAELFIEDDPGSIIDDLSCTAIASYNVNGGLWPTTKIIQANAPLADLDDNMTSRLGGLVLNKNGWMNFDDPENAEEPNCIIIQMDKDAENDTQNQTIKFSLKMDWKQFNQ